MNPQAEAAAPLPSWRRLIPSRHSRIVVTWVLVVLWALFALIRLFGWEFGYFLRIFMAFTPYVGIATILPILCAGLLRRWVALAVALASLAALMAVVLPRAVGSPDPGAGPQIRIMSQNMKLGGADPDQIVANVRSEHIDVLNLEEFTPDAQAALESAGLSTLLPYSATHPQLGATGSAIYSRYPLQDAGHMWLPGFFSQEYATVTVPGALPFTDYAVHPDAPAEPDEKQQWLDALADEPPADPHGTVRILAGDFNATFDQAPLRHLLGTGYVDVASQLGDGLVPTWPYDGRLIPPVPITLDHIFVDPRVGVVSFSTRITRNTDHKAIWATITLPKAS